MVNYKNEREFGVGWGRLRLMAILVIDASICGFLGVMWYGNLGCVRGVSRRIGISHGGMGLLVL